jgi:hypothetical protein
MSQESLAKLLADLHAERLRTWDPAALKINIDQRATLVEQADPVRLDQGRRRRRAVRPARTSKAAS